MGVLVGKKAPDFKAKAVLNNRIVDNFSLSDFRGKNVILFFYPLDFTFVCPTELHAFEEVYKEFQARNTELIGCSVDSPYSHFAWLQTPKNQGGIQGVTYPIISDLNKDISKNYDVLIDEEGVSYRGLFLIDEEGVVRHQVVNDLPLGRSVEEALRVLDALIYFKENGEVCPANWSKGKQALSATPEGVKKYFALMG